ncbi:hypothetical protein FA13DRAFT_235580 [Coprinellus micaceus]|uniref:Uncharacterized protein n=1 Tax=Coprinellus micaceus TaxID=71717 RepID=A0A4Y7SFX6_COPMI|nr:hypothetical protein FA13DRAFT_235580 [Coprinellus micaceus]
MSAVFALLRCKSKPSTLKASISKRRTQNLRRRTSFASTSNHPVSETMSTPHPNPSSSRSPRQPASNTDANAGGEHGGRGGLRGRGRGRAIANAVFEQSTAGADSPSTPRQQGSGGWKGRGGHHGQGDSHPQSRGRGGGRGGARVGARNDPPAPRPTHCTLLIYDAFDLI